MTVVQDPRKCKISNGRHKNAGSTTNSIQILHCSCHWSAEFFCVVLEHICYFFADLLTSWQIAKFASIQTWKLGYEFICTHTYTHTLWVKLDSARVNLKETYLTALYSSLQHFPLVSSSSCLLAQIICGTVFRPII